MASQDDSNCSYDPAQSKDGTFSKTFAEGGEDNQLTNENHHCMYGDKGVYTPSHDGEFNGEVAVCMDNYELYEAQLEYERKQFEKEKAAMTEKFNTECIGLQASLEKERQTVAALKNELIDVKNNYRKDNKENVEAVKEQFDAQLQTKLQMKDLAYERLDLEHKTEVDGLKARHQDDIRDIRTSHQDEIRALKGDADDLRQKLSAAKEKTNEATEEITRALTRETALHEKIQKTDAELTRANNELAELKKNYGTCLSRPKEENHGERQLHERMARLEQKTEERIAGTYAVLNQFVDKSTASTEENGPCIIEMHAQHVQKLKRRWHEKESRYESHIKELNIALEEAKTNRYAELDQDHAQEMDQKEREKEELERKWLIQCKSNIEEKNLFNSERKRLQRELVETKTKLNDMHTSLREREVLCVQHEGTICDLKKELRQAISELKEELKQAKDGEKRAILQAAADQKEAEERHRGDLEEKLKKMEAEVRTDMGKRAEEDRSTHDAQLQNLNREKEEALRQMKNAHDELVKHLEGELRKQQEASERLDREQEDRRKEMTVRLENEKTKLQADILKMQEEIDKLGDGHKARHDEMRREINDLNERFKDEETRHAQAMKREIAKSEQNRIDSENTWSDTIAEKEKRISQLEFENLALTKKTTPDPKKKKKSFVSKFGWPKDGKGNPSCTSPEDQDYQPIVDQSSVDK